MGVAILIDTSRSRALYRVARKHNSQALEADALHFSSDIWSSLTVIGGLFFVWLGYPEFDAVAAIGVALLVLFVSYRLGRRTIDALMDRVPHNLTRRSGTCYSISGGRRRIAQSAHPHIRPAHVCGCGCRYSPDNSISKCSFHYGQYRTGCT